MFSVPNTTRSGDGFYVSYNDVDGAIYGSDTTAIVIGEQMEKFYILNGDHRKELHSRIPNGLDSCLEYFRDNIAHKNFRSDDLPASDTSPTPKP